MKSIFKKISFVMMVTAMTIMVFCPPLASAQKVSKPIEWRYVVPWAPVNALIEADKSFVKIVNELSRGRLTIKLYSAGELVPPTGVFDAVSKGTVECGGDWPGYWSGKNSAFDLLGTYPLGLDQYDYVNWYFHSGGKEMYDFLYGKFNMVYFVHSVTPMESGIRSNVPIKTFEDHKGIKCRVSGKGPGYVFHKIGIAPISMAGGEIYQALQLGTIDAAEFSIPAVDYGMGLQEVTKYNITPGWHQPASAFGVLINKNVWNKLPDDLKIIVKYAAMANISYINSWYEYKNIEAIENFKKAGVTVCKLSEKDIAKMEPAAWEFLIMESKKNPDFHKIALSQFQYIKDFAKVRNYEAPFNHGRNPVIMPNLPGLK
jgi:TRAP-type mannitol/chloroaromatic compound transport system substrate-binding protein